MNKNTVASSLICIGMALPAVPAFAANPMMEEVVVTARKRAENLQEVPMAVSAFSSDQLKIAQVSDITDLQRMTPNVVLSDTGGLVAGAVQVFIRGIGNDPGFDQGVGIYIDDVYLNRTTGSLLKAYDIERIEVLKGPQGNLYGRNTIGGAIKYVTRKPGDEVIGDIGVTLGSFNAREVSGGVSGPLTESGLYGGVGFVKSQRDGIQTNVSNGDEYWTEDVGAFRTNLLWRISDSQELSVSADIMQDHSDPRVPVRIAIDKNVLSGIDFVITGANTFLGGTGLETVPNDSSLPSDKDNINSEFKSGFDQYQIETSTFAVNYVADFNEQWTMKSVTSLRKMENNQPFDFDGSDQQFITTERPVESKDFSQELQFNYSAETLKGVVGLYYLDGEQDYKNITRQYARLRAIQTHTLDTFYDNQQVKSKSIYGSLDWDFMPEWQLSVGARYTKDSKSIEQHSTLTQGFYALALLQGFPANAVVAVAPGQEALAETQPMFAGWATPYTRYFETTGPVDTAASDDWNELTPAIKLSHFYDEDTLFYGGVSGGFKAGGFQTQGGLTTPFDPETVMAYTLGMKSTLMSGRLSLNTELFYNDYQDKQFTYVYLSGSDLLQSVDNVGEMTGQGGELELRFSATDSVLLGFNVGYLDSTVKSYKTTDSTGQSVDIARFTEIGFSPKWTAQLNAQYQTELADYGTITAAGNVSWRTSSYTNSPIDTRTQFSDVQQQEEHYLLNASIAFETKDRHWNVALQGKNLEDKRVLTSSYVVGPFVTGGYNNPRTLALSLSYNF
ncbi:TonB-dependent receptor [Zhongshania sp. BJYM1]|uniref:TonB-dependent receptor n=1 Tax=Zhongshania aquatica TaxID=2965069 RepID=UPI0022B48D28|nr:TonB-dependent receptor [Marortus sp. BJYM1]